MVILTEAAGDIVEMRYSTGNALVNALCVAFVWIASPFFLVSCIFGWS